MRLKDFLRAMFLFGIACAVVPVAQAQPKSKPSKEVAKVDKNSDEEKKDEVKRIEDIAKKSKKYPGLFTVYQDTTDGKVYLEVTKAQLGKEFIHFSQGVDAPAAGSYMFRGAYGYGKIFTITKRFDKLEVALQNTQYYFSPDNALSRAAEANINVPIIYSEKIAAVSKDNSSFLMEADKLFLAEAFEQVKPSPDPEEKPGQQFKLGSLSKEKSKFVAIKNYPQNSDFIAELVFEDPYPMNYGNPSLTDPRFVSIRIRNSLIAVPQNDFKPRFDDARVGFFSEQVTDMTSAKATPYRDPIDRWFLKKKDPSAALSEPVEPIVWWIENTTPKEIRQHVRDDVLEWNKAFEKAGFKNAVVVKEQPDNADWDAGDIRYNVIRWTSSPTPQFGGYGPSFVNPRTGQILGSDVMLEYVFITNRLREGQLFETAAMDFLQDDAAKGGGRYCTFASHLQRSVMLGKQVINALDRGAAEENELLKQSIYMLTLHEVGHTLGLNHNMKASNLHDPVKINDEKLGRETGLTGSVMDYSNVNVALDPKQQGLYYDVIPGPYDHWAIQFGYGEFGAGEEQKALAELLSKSADHALLFGNDADDMRTAGRGIDPRVMIDDMSSDPLAYSVDRLKLVTLTLPKLKEKFAKPGESYQGVRNAYLVLTSEIGIGLRVVSRQIGGVYVDRSVVGQPGASAPFAAVNYQKQKDAMTFLNRYGFSPDALKGTSELYAMLQVQRRGFNLFGANEDPKIHDRILAVQRDVLDHLLHQNTLQRIVDSELYGNTYKLSEVITDLTDAIFKDDLGKSVSSARQNLQTEYVNRLTSIQAINSSYSHVAKAEAFSELTRIKTSLAKTASPDAATKAHRQYVVHLIDEVTDTRK
ncbi:zinc-dependent metalloprotease [Chryseolinea lacunae]|uniref:Zinc-dependent metalloprotease n=1 Tax=Chryseolinea lacunae TaxID=2801331 RepID=A0ABS1KJW1_9BACT|nr:zinc-dependent metalloprotease [Chryseolinea lacunae]MBL0739740.1 zinc-dependent metalloprotease [Chryseolinea lacunae]